MKKRGLLFLLVIALLVPSLLALIMSWFIYGQFEKSMEHNANNGVKNLVDSVAARLTPDRGGTFPGTHGGETVADALAEMNLPGVFAVFKDDGRLVAEYVSPDPDSIAAAELLPDNWAEKFPDSSPKTVRFAKRERFTGMRFAIPGTDLCVVGIVSWSMHFGAMVFLTAMWPGVMGILAIAMIFAIYFLNRKVVIPLRDFDREVSSLRLGSELPCAGAPGAVPELRKLRSTFAVLAQSAIEKEQLSRDYITDIVKVQEEERERISRDIHDGPLQDVTALVQRLRLLAPYLKDEKAAAELKNAEDVALTSVREMREFCNNLTPPWLDLGLRRALTELCNRMAPQLDVKIDLEVANGEEFESFTLTPATRLAYYRVAQESINNSVMHGGAKNISVRLEEHDEHLIMQITDDGKGFILPNDVKELRLQGHRGLSNMKERIRLAGGTMEIKSLLRIGTIISCEVPIHKVK